MISLRSEITKKLLYYFFMNPHVSLYVNEISHKLKLDKRNLVKKIKEMEKEGIFTSDARGNLKFYSLNARYPLFNELRNIILKTIGLEDRIKKVIKEIPGIKEAYIYGSYARNKLAPHSDIDILVIGKHDVIAMQKHINMLQKEIDREINIVNMSETEFIKRQRNKDPFIKSILNEKHIRIEK